MIAEAGRIRFVLTTDRIVFAVNNSEFGPTGFPVIRSSITIQGNGNRVFRDNGAPEFRIFAVATNGDLTLVNARVSGGVVSGGEGSDSGGIHNLGTLTLTNSTVSGNTAGDNGGGINNKKHRVQQYRAVRRRHR